MKILIVEDIALIRMTTADMVEEIGHAPVEAGDAEEALAVIKSDPEISIMLTDLGLPGMSGRQLIDETLKIRPDMKVIIASGRALNRDEIPPHAIVLMKPFDIEHLRKALSS